MKTPITYSEETLSELVLYVGAKCGLDEHYGVLKLNKILFYSDFFAFKSRGKPITGAEYRKYPRGPAPAVMKRLRQKLEFQRDAFEYKNPLPSLDDGDEPRSEKRLLPLRAPQIDKFLAPEEIAIVDRVIEWLRPKTGQEVSRMSHAHPGWRLAEMEAEIPYFAALLPDGDIEPLSAKDLKRAKLGVARFTAA